jgi:hypothetical protein
MEKNTEIKKQDNGLIFTRSQDATAILQANHEARVDPAKDLRFGRRVASVPMVILEKWIEEGIDYRKISKDPDMKKRFFAKLNDPTWRSFKTTTGHIG